MYGPVPENLPDMETRVRSLVWRDSSYCGETKPVCLNYWSPAQPIKLSLKKYSDGLLEERKLSLILAYSMPGTWVLLLLSYGFLITSLQVKSQTLHFITEEIKVQRWEVVCTPQGQQVQGQAPLTWGLGSSPTLWPLHLLLVLLGA